MRRWKDNIKLNLKIQCEGVDSSHTDELQSLVNRATNLIFV
jgi:hypothetical protein